MKQLLYSAGFFLAGLNVNAQNIDSTLSKYSSTYEQERMYLHFDKSSYAQGETIWFKAYLLKTIFPANESKTVYIDWSDENGNLLYHTINAVEDATTYGQFEIPKNYSGRYIHVKAYTKWMLNFDPIFLYNKDLKIISGKNGNLNSGKKIIPELNFFPEGGDVINGVTNKIVFKANDQYGRPIQIKGVIKDDEGSVIDSLKILHDGMGYFFIIPHEGEIFSASWQDEEGVEHATQLPLVKNTGVSLRVALLKGKRIFSINVSPASALLITEVHILGTMYQQEIFNLDEILTNGKAEGTVPTESLPSGILTITVFDKDWRPLAERITYVNNEEYSFQPAISIDSSGTGKRAKNEFKISVPDNLSSSLSVSVTDAKIDYDNSDNMISHLLLTGELKGYVYDADHYFLNNSDSVANQLDLVMLTHGWRRFDWQQVVQGKFPVIKYPKDTSYLFLSGKVFGASPSQLKNAGDIILMLNQDSSGTQAFTIPVQPNGTFVDPSFILFDTARIFYNFSNSKSLKNISVKFMPDILSPFSNNVVAGSSFGIDPFTERDKYQIHLNDELEEQLKHFDGKVLATVKIKAHLKTHVQEINDKYTNGLFKGGNATELDLTNDPLAVTYTDIVSYIQGKVPGLTFDNLAHKFLWLRNRSGENGPTLYLNEMATSYDMISSIPVANVAFIKVFRPGFVGGVGSGTGGAIVIYTRMGGDGQTVKEKGLNNNLVTGYTATREFYSPDYEKMNTDDSKGDFRSTLYWNPSIITTPDRNTINIDFYNNDVSNSFRVVIEGITQDGHLAHLEKIIK